MMAYHDNTPPMEAERYDQEILDTVPYYVEFYRQTLDVIEQCRFPVLDWLDLGCGTGTLEELAFQRFSAPHFVLIDPSEQMLIQAKEKLKGRPAQYICADSASIDFECSFHAVTAILSHHYMHPEQREEATKRIFRALKERGIYISFENVIPEAPEVKAFELQRWGSYQQSRGRTEEQVNSHMARCGVNYFPITVREHIRLLKETGFKSVHVFWYSYMQMGIYGIK